MTEPRAWLYEHPEGHLNVSVSRDAHGTWEGWLERPLYGPEAADRIIALEADVARLREALVQHNELLRSASAIADRDGKDTNWLAFRGQVYFTLAEYHELAVKALAALEARNV